MKTKKEGVPGRLRSPGMRPGEGYRSLKVGELLRPTDEVWEWGVGPWKPFNTPLKRGERRQSYHAPIRRRIKTRSVGGAQRSRPSPKATQKRKSP